MASFYSYLPLLQQVEGGYTDNPNDNGNWTGGRKGIGQLVGTNYGISAPVYKEWIGRTPTRQDMLSLTKDTAKKIFKNWYWDAIKASQINSQSVANIIVDHGVNAGLGSIGKIVQRILNNHFNYNLRIDGVIGPATRAAINSVNSKQLHDLIKLSREEFYEKIDNEHFRDGWLVRLSKFVYEKKK